jgi:hypothetical protein
MGTSHRRRNHKIPNLYDNLALTELSNNKRMLHKTNLLNRLEDWILENVGIFHQNPLWSHS